MKCVSARSQTSFATALLLYKSIPMPCSCDPWPVKIYAETGCSTSASASNTFSSVSALLASTLMIFLPATIPTCCSLTSIVSSGNTIPTSEAWKLRTRPTLFSAAHVSTRLRTAALEYIPCVIVPGKFAYFENTLDTWIGL